MPRCGALLVNTLTMEPVTCAYGCDPGEDDPTCYVLAPRRLLLFRSPCEASLAGFSNMSDPHMASGPDACAAFGRCSTPGAGDMSAYVCDFNGQAYGSELNAACVGAGTYCRCADAACFSECGACAEPLPSR